MIQVNKGHSTIVSGVIRGIFIIRIFRYAPLKLISALASIFIITSVSAQETMVFNSPPPPMELADSLFPELTRGLIRKSNDQPKTVIMKIEFEFGSSNISPESKGFIESIANMLKLDGVLDKAIMIEGHTDAVGSNRFNLNLSEQRAEAVRRTLVRQFNIAPERLLINGKGESELLDPANPHSASNRRVEIKARPNS